EFDARIGRRRARRRRPRLDLEHAPRPDLVARAARPPLDANPLFAAPALDCRARRARAEASPPLVDPIGGGVGAELEPQRHQMRLFTCPFDFTRMSTRALS